MRTYGRFLLVLCLGLLLNSGVRADVKLPKLISNGMVLQRGQPLTVWGWASPAEKVTVKFLNKTHHAVAAPDGTWKIMLKPIGAGGPYTMDIAGNNQLQLTDIMV